MEIRRAKLRWVAVAGIALIFTLAGCGKSGAGGTSRTQGMVSAERPEEFISGGGPPKGRPVRGFCGHANVAVGSGSHLLKVTAWCAGTKVRPRVNFTLSRHVPGHPARTLARPGQVKSISGTGSRARSSGARCLPVQQGVICSAAAHGPLQLHMTLSVPPKTRCRLEVLVITSFDGTCPNRPCAGALTTYSLFSGRPKGC
jgi:hypothetical protein